MVSKKQNPPPPKPVEEEEEEEYSEEEVEEEVEEEEEIEEEVEEEEEDEGHQEKPQVSSSSGDETDSNQGDETDSNEDEDRSSISKRIQPSIQNLKKPTIQRQSTSPPVVVRNSVSVAEDTESEGEEEEEDAELTNAELDLFRSPTASEYTVRPITVPANTKGTKFNNTKRPLEDGKGSGNGKKAKTGEENDKKGKGASRIWSEENEIVVLQGLIDYQKRKGPFRPTLDLGVFYECIKGKLWDGITKNQISDKLKRAKSKYSQNVKKGKNGQDPVFSKPHEKKIFDLSKQIWGPGSESNGIEDKAKIKGDDGKGKKAGNSGSENKKIEDNAKVKSDNPKGKKGDNAGSASIPSMDVDKDEKQDVKMQDLDDEEEDFLSKFPTLSKSFDADMGFLKENLHLIGHQMAGELEEKWKQLQEEEMAVLAKRFNIQSEQIKMVLDAMKKQ